MTLVVRKHRMNEGMITHIKAADVDRNIGLILPLRNPVPDEDWSQKDMEKKAKGLLDVFDTFQLEGLNGFESQVDIKREKQIVQEMQMLVEKPHLARPAGAEGQTWPSAVLKELPDSIKEKLPSTYLEEHLQKAYSSLPVGRTILMGEAAHKIRSNLGVTYEYACALVRVMAYKMQVEINKIHERKIEVTKNGAGEIDTEA